MNILPATRRPESTSWAHDHDHIDVTEQRASHPDGAEDSVDGDAGPIGHRAPVVAPDGESPLSCAAPDVGDAWLKHRLRDTHPTPAQRTSKDDTHTIKQLNTGRQDPLSMGALRNDPEWLKSAFGELHVREGRWSATNPRILEYFDRTYRKGLHVDDSGKENAWCSAFVTFTLSEAGVKNNKAVGAREYETWGEPSEPFRGAVVVLQKGRQKHVAFLAGVDQQGRNVYLGGNQNDAVSLSVLPGYEVITVRKPKGHQVSAESRSLPLVKPTTDGLASTR